MATIYSDNNIIIMIHLLHSNEVVDLSTWTNEVALAVEQRSQIPVPADLI